jgi:WD40 repeat protein
VIVLVAHAAAPISSVLQNTVSAEEKPAATTPAEAPPKVSYYKEIRPILQTNCQGCHQAARTQGKYIMTDFAALIKGGASGDPAVIPGKPEESFLIEEITPVAGKASMPKNASPLLDTEIALISRWIKEGATDDTPPAAKIQYDQNHPPVYARSAVISSLDFSPQGQQLAVNGFHEALLLNAESGAVDQRLIGVAERIETVTFSPNGDRLLVVGGLPGRMGEAQIWDIGQHKLVQSIASGFDTLYGGSWSPQGDLIAFGGADRAVRAFNAKSGKQVLFQGAHDDWVLGTVFSPDQAHLVSIGRDMSVKLIEVATERFVDNITSITPGALKGGVNAVDRCPTRDEVVIGGSDGIVKVYRMQRLTKRVIGDDANLIRKLPPMPGRVMDLAVSQDGKRIVAVSSLDGQGFISVYSYEFDTSLPKEIVKINEKIPSGWTAEEKKLIEEYWTKDVKVIAEAKLPESALYAVSIHPTKSMFAVGGADGVIRYYDLETAKVQQEIRPAPFFDQKSDAKKKTFHLLTADENTKADAYQAKSAEKPTEVKILAPPAPQEIVSIQYEPSVVTLDQPFVSVQLLVTGINAQGEKHDLTRVVKYGMDPHLGFVSARGQVRPLADGETALNITYGSHKANIPVKITGVEPQPQVDFLRDVNPILSRLGCNQGTCHGSAQGKNGFKLSLRGYDPIFDIRALKDDHACRRLNSASPDDSLMLLKPTGSVPHEGGVPFTTSDPYYQVLRQWIVNGAPLDLQTPRVAKIEIAPQNPIVEKLGGQQQMRIVAHYTNGQTRDVTQEAFIDSGNTEVAKTDRKGVVTAIRRGEASILARYEGAYIATTLTVMGDRQGFQWQDPPANNKIDELVAAKWQRLKIQPSELCTDAEFLRRVTLDLTGLPPTADQVRAFLADQRETRVKRDELIDKLLESDASIDYWTNKWADLLQVNGKFLGREGATAFRDWIRQQVASKRPYDEFVKEIVTASGSNKSHPAASYYKVLRTPDMIVENTTHLFLSIRFNCNKCHDHPFERWTQNQYYETAAFFARVDFKEDPESKGKKIGGTAVEGAKPLFEIVGENKTGEVKHDRTGDVTAPKFPYDCDHAHTPDGEEPNRREEFASWLTSRDNPYFARSHVNRLFGYMMGVGIIEPLDDIRAGNPPSNPELLQYLTKEFIAHDFDNRHILRIICQSRTYQLSLQSNKWNVDDKSNYSHAMARRLPAETLLDSIFSVTGSVTNFPGVPKGTRAAALPDSEITLPDGFLAKFGKPVRESTCECERSNEVQLGPVMALISGPTVSGAIGATDNLLQQLVTDIPDDSNLIRELYLRIVNRPVHDQEIQTILDSWKEIDIDHQKLTAAFQHRDEEVKKYNIEIEKQKVIDLAAAQTDLDAYREQIAPQEKARADAREQLIKDKTKQLDDYVKLLPQKQAAWEKTSLSTVEWIPLAFQSATSTNKDKLQLQSDRSIFVEGNAAAGTYVLTVPTKLTGITGIRLEALPDARLKANGPGLSGNGNFVITEFQLKIAQAGQTKFEDVELNTPLANFAQKDLPVTNLNNGDTRNGQTGWAVSPHVGSNHWFTIKTKTPTGFDTGSVLRFEIHQYHTAEKHRLGRFRISVTTQTEPTGLSLPETLQSAIQNPLANRPKDQAELVKAHFELYDKDLNDRKTQLADANKPLVPDAGLVKREARVAKLKEPIPPDPLLTRLRTDLEFSQKQMDNKRLTAAQDLVWVLINTPEFLFNH